MSTYFDCNHEDDDLNSVNSSVDIVSHEHIAIGRLGIYQSLELTLCSWDLLLFLTNALSRRVVRGCLQPLRGALGTATSWVRFLRSMKGS